jgi:hypothetical protein
MCWEQIELNQLVWKGFVCLIILWTSRFLVSLDQFVDDAVCDYKVGMTLQKLKDFNHYLYIRFAGNVAPPYLAVRSTCHAVILNEKLHITSAK